VAKAESEENPRNTYQKKKKKRTVFIDSRGLLTIVRARERLEGGVADRLWQLGMYTRRRDREKVNKNLLGSPALSQKKSATPLQGMNCSLKLESECKKNSGTG
jgi:hypothetical protein